MLICPVICFSTASLSGTTSLICPSDSWDSTPASSFGGCAFKTCSSLSMRSSFITVRAVSSVSSVAGTGSSGSPADTIASFGSAVGCTVASGSSADSTVGCSSSSGRISSMPIGLPVGCSWERSWRFPRSPVAPKKTSEPSITSASEPKSPSFTSSISGRDRLSVSASIIGERMDRVTASSLLF